MEGLFRLSESFPEYLLTMLPLRVVNFPIIVVHSRSPVSFPFLVLSVVCEVRPHLPAEPMEFIVEERALEVVVPKLACSFPRVLRVQDRVGEGALATHAPLLV